MVCRKLFYFFIFRARVKTIAINLQKTMPEEKRGRKKVKESAFVTRYKYQGASLDFLRKYIFQEKLAELFKKGKLCVKLSEETLALTYTPPQSHCALNLNLMLNFKTRREFDEAFSMVQDFLMDCFYFHEWDGRPLRLTELGVILGVSKQAVHREIRQILKKINSNEKCLEAVMQKLKN